MLMVKASTAALKKKDSTQCAKLVRRMARVVMETSAVCPEVPMTPAKYKKSP